MTRAESSKGSMNGSLSGSTQSLTTVGRINHDPTRHQAPSFSFGVRLEDKIKQSPGPQYSVAGDLSYRGTGHSPSYSLGRKRPRSIFDVGPSDSGPGPNAYSVSTGVNRSPMFSFGLLHHDPYRNRPAPAPNAYKLPTTLGWNVPHLRGAPASTLVGKGSQNKGFSYDHAKTPGPAGYGSVDPGLTSKRAPAATLTGRTKLPPIKFVTPGPGAYEQGKGYSAVSKSSPRISMGIRHGENVKPMFTPADVSD